MPTATDQTLRDAENELKIHRERAAHVVAFIHDPAYDRDARQGLAERLGLPGPCTIETPKGPRHGG
jgi:hypothetical protein